MFQSLARLVNTRGWIIIVGWMIVTVVLFKIAPTWESVSKDDDVNFFPAGYPSVVGQSLLQRGFPQGRRQLASGDRGRACRRQADANR